MYLNLDLSHETDYTSEDGTLVTINSGFLDDIIRVLRSGSGDRYGYARGKRLTSKMPDEEIYALLYGSKEEYDKKYPYGENSYEGVETLKKERFYRLYEVANDDARSQQEKIIKDEEELTVDVVGSELILALDAGASFEEVACLLKKYGESAAAYSFYEVYVTSYSKKGKEFKEYLDQKKKEELNNNRDVD